jgi:hypothetical protein
MEFLNSYYTNTSSLRTNVGRIYNLLPYISGLDYLVDRYRGYKKSVDDIYDKDREEGKLTDVEKKLWMPFDEIKEKVRQVSNPRESLLTKLYCDLAPRRTRAYCLLKVIKNNTTDTKLKSNEIIPENWSKSEQEINNNKGVKYSDYNYAIFKKNVLTKIILNQYKTSAQYGTYVVSDIPKSIQEASKLYVSEAKLNTGDALFPNNQYNHYTNQGFSGYIKLTFEKYTGKKLGSNILRHSFITMWSIQNPNSTVAQKKKIAAALGHREQQFDLYKRFVEKDPILKKKIKKVGGLKQMKKKDKILKAM